MAVEIRTVDTGFRTSILRRFMDTIAAFSLEFEKPIRDLIEQLDRLVQISQENEIDVSLEIQAIERKIEDTKKEVYGSMDPWQRVQMARHTQRPYSLDYIGALFEDFQELHGDRRFRDDAAIVGGLAQFEGQSVMVIGQQKGRNTKDNLLRNFGCANPEGYRKALRLMKLAEKFQLPVITFIDTPGAYPGIGAEERHVAEAIALNIMEMSALKTPIISVVIGEGGSGGALGMAVADVVLVLENAWNSVISPEGCAAILWKDRAKAKDAASALKVSAQHVKEFEIADAIIPEPLGGAHHDPQSVFDALRKRLNSDLKALQRKKVNTLLDHRYKRYRKLGPYAEAGV